MIVPLLSARLELAYLTALRRGLGPLSTIDAFQALQGIQIMWTPAWAAARAEAVRNLAARSFR